MAESAADQGMTVDNLAVHRKLSTPTLRKLAHDRYMPGQKVGELGSLAR
ncbi:MAG: hypothetical protein RMJ35_13640 [Phycisphaerales bacterium]|nr:hypothetical protein [Phycisphaerales bacterium]